MGIPYIGEVRMFGGNFAPLGWAFCDGQILQIAEYETLFSLLGTTYGGDGQSTFALPDLRGRIPLHMGKNPSTGTQYTLAEKAGVETVTLVSSQLPKHSHNVSASSDQGTTNTPSNAVWASNMQQFSKNLPDGTMNAATITSVGGNQPHDNMMPFAVISFIIALEGEFPPRD